MDTYKTILVGEGGCGKTTWLSRIMAEKTGAKLFEKKYIATLGVQVQPIVALSPTTGEQYIANIWDCAGQEKFSGLGDGYYIQAQAAIFAFDLSSHYSLGKIPGLLRNVLRVTGPIPYVIVGLKSDVRTIAADNALLRTFIDNTHYVEVSTKTGDNVHEPLRILHRQLNPGVVAIAKAKL